MNLVRDILVGTVAEKMRNQGMFTMSKVDDSDGRRRELWLVPVRTVKKTLAVLLVHISADRMAPSPSLPQNTSMLDPPQAIVSHFAAIFAPVLYAATVVETQRVREEEHEKIKQELTRLHTEMVEQKRQLGLIVSVLDLSASAKIDVPISLVLETSLHEKVIENLSSFSSSLSSILSRDVNICATERDASVRATIRDDDLVERVLDEDDKVLGTVIIAAESRDAAESSLHSPFIIKVVARLVSSVVSRILRHEQLGMAYQKVTRDLESYQEHVHELTDDVNKVLSEKKALTLTGLFYRSLTDVIHKCLSFSANGGEAGYLLRDVCARIPSLIPSEAVLSFALVGESDDQNDLVWHHADDGTFAHTHFPRGRYPLCLWQAISFF